MGASESLLVAGIVCIVAAVVGGGVKMLGAEMPVLGSFARQALLFFVGLAFLVASFAVNQAKPGPPAPVASASPPAAGQPASGSATPPPAPAQSAPPMASGSAPASSGAAGSAAPIEPAPASPPVASGLDACGPATALGCLPRSSAPVTFRDLSAANAAAARNIRQALSTTQGAAQAASEGATGRAARLCGIIASNDSSPLGKHLAAQRLTTPGAVDGQASLACLAMANNFL